MTSEIRANTLKNRVGLGTVEYTNTGIVVSGIVTANSFSGPLITTSIDLNGDLDVDGHTNLDNVSIAGVTTTGGLLDINAGGQANTFKVEDLTSGRVVLAGTGGELEDSGNLTFNGTTLNCVAGVGPQIRFENQHSVTTDAAISTFDDSSGTLLCLGSNFYMNSSGSETRYNTSEESAGIIINRNGYINFFTGSTGATGVLRFGIASDGKVLIDNSTGTLTIGGDNVYDSAKINLMVGSSSQTSATTEATAIVIHDRNSQRNGTEGAGSWKSKIVFRSTQINGNYQSEGASIVHDITYNNYSSTKTVSYTHLTLPTILRV